MSMTEEGPSGEFRMTMKRHRFGRDGHRQTVDGR